MPYYNMDDSIHIALCGPKCAGRTIYLSVLAHELPLLIQRHNVLACIDFQNNNLLNSYFESLYTEHMVVSYTGYSKNPCFIIYLTFFNLSNRTKNIALILYDVPGEFFTPSNYKYPFFENILAKSDGIFFMVDPLQISNIRLNTKDESMLPLDNVRELNGLHLNCLKIITDILNKSKDTNAVDKISLPFAFIITKCDVISYYGNKYVENEVLFKEDGYEENCSSDDIKKYLYHVGETDLIKFVNNNIKTNGFFSISSIGQITRNGHFDFKPEPINIDAPLIWMLKKCLGKDNFL